MRMRICREKERQKEREREREREGEMKKEIEWRDYPTEITLPNIGLNRRLHVIYAPEHEYSRK